MTRSSIPNAGFTRGPWNASATGKGVYGCGSRIARMTSGEKHDLANARLIATAPELYEAVCELTDAMHRYEMDVDADAPAEHREMMRKAHAALAKARGEA